MKSKLKADFFLKNIICLCLILSGYAAIPFNRGHYQSSSFNSNPASRPNIIAPLGMRQPSSNNLSNNSNKRTLQPQLNSNPSMLSPPPKSHRSAGERILSNATVPIHNARITSSFNNIMNISRPGKADVIPVVLKQSAVNANDKSKPNMIMPIPNGRNSSSMNSTMTFSKPGKADVIPAVLKQSDVNANNIPKPNITVPVYNGRNASSFNNTPKFSKSAGADIIPIPVVLKQSAVNANDKSKPNMTIPIHSGRNSSSSLNSTMKFSEPGKADVIPAASIPKPNITVPVYNGRNDSSFNNTPTISKSAKADIIPVVLKQSAVNLNTSNSNITAPVHNGRNSSSFNNTTKFSKSGNADVTPVVLKQSNVNANDKSKPVSTQSLNSMTPPANNFFHNGMDFGQAGSNNLNSGPFNDRKSVSSVVKALIKGLKKSDTNSYALDYGRPVRNKGSGLKLFGGKIVNSVTGYFISIVVVYAATYRCTSIMHL